MKTFTICWLLLLAGSLAVNAQTQKGRWTVGAQAGNVSYQNQNGGRSLTVSISPSAGYFVADGLVVGTGIPLSINHQKNTADNPVFTYNYKTSSIGLSPFVRYYVGQHKLKPYLGLAYS